MSDEHGIQGGRRGWRHDLRAASALIAALIWLPVGVHAQAPVPTVVTQVVGGVHHSCAVTTTGTVWCWGRNAEGQLGDGTNTDRPAPVQVAGLVDAIAIAAYGEESTIVDATSHTCALTDAGTVKCWGSNAYGQLGIGSIGAGSNTPVDVPGLAGVAAIAVGSRHTCALTSAGAVRCWGENDKGQLGDGTRVTRTSPTPVPGLASGVSAIAAGYRNTCAILDGVGARCWGYNNFGQVGNGAIGGDPASGGVLTPTAVAGLGATPTAITTGAYHACAIVAGGAKCWGANLAGQLGNDGALLAPVDVFGLTSGVAKLSAGIRHTCAVTTAGAAKCWGENDHGQAGPGFTSTSRSQTTDPHGGEVFGLASGVLEISGGYQHTCAVTVDGSVRCWGSNPDGRVGHGAALPGPNVLLPVTPSGLASSIASAQADAGRQHSCTRTTGGGVLCWGRNVEGQLGNGATLPGPAAVAVPVAVSGLTDIEAVANGGAHTCALTTGGGVKCWGSNSDGQLGVVGAGSATPVDVTGLLSGVAAIATGERHSCALLAAGGVKCWGSNSRGQVGNNVDTGGQENSPVDVHTSSSDTTPLGGVSAITAGEFHNCAVVGTGAKCWGYNNAGQLGNGTTALNNANGGIATPVDVAGAGGTIDAIAGGAEHTCAKIGSNAKCWGRGTSGQIGNNAFSDSLAPAPVLDGAATPMSGVVKIDAGSNHSCATTTQGLVKCWGRNDHGQLGDGTLNNAALTRVARGFDLAVGVVGVAAGLQHTCAVAGSGLARCWGANGDAQLGDSTLTERLSPADVLVGSQALAFAAPAALKYVTPVALTATASSGLAAEFDSWTPATCNVSGTTVNPTELGLCGLRAKQPGNADFRHAPQQLRVLVVGKADQAIVISPIADRTFNDPPVALSTSQQGGSGNPVQFSSLTPAVCTVAGTTATIVGAGTCTIAADQAGASHYNAGYATLSFNVAKADQAIAFGTAPAPTYTPGGQFTVSATASPSGLVVTFSVPVTTSVCTSAGGGTVDIVTAGTCTVVANQAGNDNYNAAPAVNQDVVIAKADQAVSFGAVGSKTFGDPAFTISATGGGSGNPIAFSQLTPAFCTVSGDQVTIVGAGLCVVGADQAGSTSYNAGHAEKEIPIDKASQAIAGFGPFGGKTYGDAAFSVAGASGGASGSPVYFVVPATTGVCTVTLAGMVTIAGAGTCTVEARQDGTADYHAAPAVAQSFTVDKASQAIAGFGPLGDKTHGDPSFSVSASVTGGSSGNPVYFVVPATTGVCTVTLAGTVTIVGAGTCTIEARQDGNANYNAAPAVPQSFGVAKANQAITFAALGDRTRIDPPFAISASASPSGLAVVFSVPAPSAAFCSVSGNTVTIVGVGTCTIDANQPGDANYNPAPTVSRSFTVSASVPGQPVITSATPGNQRATIAFTLGTDGGSPITGFDVSCTPAGSGSGMASPIAITGLTNGVPYTCAVTASNGLGAGQASATANVVPSAGPFAYLADLASSVVRIVEVAGDSVLGSIAVGANPVSVVVSPDAADAYVANFGDGTVSVIDTGTNLVTNTISVGAGPAGLAISPDATRVYASNRNSNDVSVINSATNAVIATVAVGSAPSGIAVTPDGARVFVANSGSDSVSVIATASNTVVATIPLGLAPQGLAARPGGGKVYVAATTPPSILVLDAATGSQLASIPVSPAPGSVAFKHDGSRAYVGHTAGNLLTVIDAGTNLVVTTVPMGGNVTGVSVGPDDAEVFVALGNTGQVKLVDTLTSAVTVTINGMGMASGFSSGFVTPILPGAPAVGAATSGSGQATIAFTAPASNGGSPILHYTATCNPGGFSASAPASPITVTGLSNGTAYSCSVTATNAVGTGPASGAGGVTPSTLPVITSAASVTFTVNAAATPFTVTASGTPAPTLSRSGPLPAGVTFSATTGQLSGTPALGTVGSYPITFSATNPGGTANQNFTLTVAKANQTITFGALPNQNFGAPPPALSASATSGLAVAFSSLTTPVCTVSGTTLSILAAGTCTVAANQPGNANYNGAPQVSRSFAVAAVAPGAPTIGSAGAGNGQATIAFSPPASNGGSAITSYTATCNPGGFTKSGAGSPLVVTGLANGVAYTCSVTATNSAGTGAPSATVGVTPVVAQISINPPGIDFGGQSMGTTSPARRVTVTNTGTTTLTIASVTLSGAQFAQANNCTSLVPGANCAIDVTFSPAPVAGAINSAVPVSGGITIASNSPGSPHAIGLAGTAEKSLVTHYYRSILRRAPDAGGKAFWDSEAARMQSIGANVNETWFSMSAFFYFSAEYVAFNRTDTEFVTDLYNTFFNRAPDGGGLAFWTGQIASGMPREVVLASFMFSTEFANFTQAIFGNTAARAEVDMVLDFYRGLLARLPDQGGFDFWVAQFRTAQCAGASAAGAVYMQVESISSSFATGGEYLAKNRTNAQYIGDLYNSFLRRGGDLGGVSFWINQLDTSAMTREFVRQQFLASTEFTARVNNVIAQGCLP